jgi:hypothetical protein
VLGILGGTPQVEGTSVPTETVFAEVKINIKWGVIGDCSFGIRLTLGIK